MERRWEHFPHEADMGVRGIGKSKAEAFEEIAKALMEVIADLKTIQAKEKIHVSRNQMNGWTLKARIDLKIWSDAFFLRYEYFLSG